MADVKKTSPVTEIINTLKILTEPDQTIELRILKTRHRTISGYYQNEFEKLAKDAAEWNGEAPGIYITLNPVKPALLSRSANHAKKYADITTGDADILNRRWLPIDFDPIRPAGISSTDAEHQAAITRATDAAQWLKKELNFPDGILADSGNGAHLLYRIESPNSKESTALVEKCLKAVDFRFTDNIVAVDLTCFNAARIWKLYGTLACKGDHTQDRPHRKASIIFLPQKLEIVS